MFEADDELGHLSKATMQTLVIIPTYNERENIEALLTQVLQQQADVHVLVVDDNSPDGTAELVEEFGRSKHPGQVHLLKRLGKLGLGTAYVEGFKWALARQYDYVVQMDADFSHNPIYLSDFLREIERSDVVLGSRYIPGGGVKGWGLLRQLISKGGNIYARTILRLPFRDLTGGYKCFRREVLEAIGLDEIRARGYAFQIETTYRAICKGFTVTEIPIIFEDRVRGKSQFSSEIFLEAMAAVWRLRGQMNEQKKCATIARNRRV